VSRTNIHDDSVEEENAMTGSKQPCQRSGKIIVTRACQCSPSSRMLIIVQSKYKITACCQTTNTLAQCSESVA
jgi:hypothetical protein